MSAEKPLTNDDIFDILSNSRRRRLLYYLEKRDGSAELRELARLIATAESDSDTEEVPSDAIRRVYISLYQLHVPNLQEFGLVEYDEDTTLVSMTERVDEMFELFVMKTSPWPRYYVAIALGGAIFLGAIAFDVFPVSAITAAFLIVVGVAGMSIVHYLSEARSQPREVISELV